MMQSQPTIVKYQDTTLSEVKSLQFCEIQE